MKINSSYQIGEEEKSNILSVKDENDNDNDEEKHLEQMQILNEGEKNKLLISPEEQFKNNPNYKFFTFLGIKFCKIGNTLACNFDSKNNNDPKICIGPHWYLAIVSNLLITVLVSSMYVFLIESNSPIIQKLLYIFFGFMVYYFFNTCALINPGIVQSKKRDSENIGYCEICDTYYNPFNKVEHCSMCGICVEKMDHHCVWVGKCVGKKNCFHFYAMLVSIGVVYAYIIFLEFLNYSLKVKNVRKK